MSTQKIDLIRQALSAAESSVKLARQLLGDLEHEEGNTKPKAKELPGLIGIFDGQNMTTEKGETHPVPENYASKSILVVGDTLKLVEEGGERRFKQIEHVKRHKTIGMVSKKDGKWVAVTPEGSYRLLPVAVSHFNGDVGDEALLQIPAANLQTTWAAVEKIMKKGAAKEEEKTAPSAGQDKKEPPAEKQKVTEPKEKVEKAVKKEEKPKEEPKVKVEETKETEEQKEKEVKEEAKVEAKEEVKEAPAPVAEKPPEAKPVEEVKPESEKPAEVKPSAKTAEISEDELA